MQSSSRLGLSIWLACGPEARNKESESWYWRNFFLCYAEEDQDFICRERGNKTKPGNDAIKSVWLPVVKRLDDVFGRNSKKKKIISQEKKKNKKKKLYRKSLWNNNYSRTYETVDLKHPNPHQIKHEWAQTDARFELSGFEIIEYIFKTEMIGF